MPPYFSCTQPRPSCLPNAAAPTCHPEGAAGSRRTYQSHTTYLSPDDLPSSSHSCSSQLAGPSLRCAPFRMTCRRTPPAPNLAPHVLPTLPLPPVILREPLAPEGPTNRLGDRLGDTASSLKSSRGRDRLGDTASSLKSSRGHSIFLARCPGLGQWPGYLRFVAAA